MVYPYIVNLNGKWYKAGEDVPALNTATKSEDKKIEKVIEKVEEVPTELPFTFTKTDINRLSTKELKQLAKEQGFENVDEKSGSELKRMLIQKNGL